MSRGKNATVLIEVPDGTFDRDGRGVAVPKFKPSKPFRAVATLPSLTEEENMGDSHGVGLENAVVRIPREVLVTMDSRVTISDVDHLAGEYLVIGIRPNRHDTRVILRRRSVVDNG